MNQRPPQRHCLNNINLYFMGCDIDKCRLFVQVFILTKRTVNCSCGVIKFRINSWIDTHWCKDCLQSWSTWCSMVMEMKTWAIKMLGNFTRFFHTFERRLWEYLDSSTQSHMTCPIFQSELFYLRPIFRTHWTFNVPGSEYSRLDKRLVWQPWLPIESSENQRIENGRVFL